MFTICGAWRKKQIFINKSFTSNLGKNQFKYLLFIFLQIFTNFFYKLIVYIFPMLQVKKPGVIFATINFFFN